jgi:ketosteroid isomerase-like protein
LKSIVFFISILSISILCPSCHQRTEEDAVLDTVDSLVRLAEKKDLEAIMAYFTEDFTDFEGRDKAGIRSLLLSYFSGRTGIVVHRLSHRIVSLEAGRAALDTELALSSGGAEALRRLVRISPDIYRLRVEFTSIREEWLVRYAEWSSVGLTEIFPESLSELKKIFPKI